MFGMIRRVAAKNRYDPGFAGIFLNPFYLARKGLYLNIFKLSPRLKGKLLDVGCGERPYESLFKGSKYVGLEYENTENRAAKKADCFYNGKKFPFKSASFDSVLCNQVLEHVFWPDEFVSEIWEVLKPQGVLLITVPFVWDEHEQPVDYARYSSYGLVDLLKRNGFAIIEQHKSVQGLPAIFQLLNAYIFKLVSWNPFLKYFAMIFVMSIITLLGVISGILPKGRDLYLDNVILARKVSK